MPRISGDKLLQQAITSAVDDRISLSDSYPSAQPEYAQFRQQAKAFEGLRGLKLKSMSEVELKLAFQVFVCAEQWEESLADANHNKGDVAQECMRKVKLWKTFRHATFGRTKMEVILAESKAVDIRTLGENDKLER